MSADFPACRQGEMLAVVSTAGADGGRITVATIPVSVLTPDTVLVRVKATAVNRGEIAFRKAHRAGPPQVTGMEFAGVVEKAGSDVRGVRVGDRVMGRNSAAHAQYVVTDPRLLMPIPQQLSFEQAAAIPNVFVTAHDALVTNAHARPGEAVLVNAASSGVGTAALQIARQIGAGTVIAVSRDADKLARLSRLIGPFKSIATDHEELVPAVQRLTDGRGVDVVIDCVGASVLQANMDALALGGRLVSVGRIAETVGRIDMNLLALRRLQLIGVTFRTRSHAQQVDCVAAFWHDLGAALEQGQLVPVVHSVHRLADIEAAYAEMERNTAIGKIVLAVP